MRKPNAVRGALIAALACAPLLSCPKEQAQALLILDAAALTRQTQCMFQAGTNIQFILLNGVLDLAITNRYWLYPHFRNLLPTINEATGEGVSNLYPPETNYVNVHTVRVHVNLGQFYSAANTSDIPTMERYRLDGFEWDSGVSVAPGDEGVTAVQVIPPDLGNLLFRLIRSYPNASNPGIWINVVIQLVGRTQDMWTVYSNEFKFPIMVCYGCLIRPTTNNPANPPTTTNIPCNPGQDEGVDDTLCRLIAIHKDACFAHLTD